MARGRRGRAHIRRTRTSSRSEVRSDLISRVDIGESAEIDGLFSIALERINPVRAAASRATGVCGARSFFLRVVRRVQAKICAVHYVQCVCDYDRQL